MKASRARFVLAHPCFATPMRVLSAVCLKRILPLLMRVKYNGSRDWVMPVECGWGREIASERDCKEVQVNYRVLNNLLPLNVNGMPLQCEWYQSSATEERFFTARTRVQTSAFLSHDGTRVRVIPVEVFKGIFAVWTLVWRKWCQVRFIAFLLFS